MGSNPTNIASCFDHLLGVLSSGSFLRMEGRGGEVPFYICPYQPEDQLEMEKLPDRLSSRLSAAGISVLSINLYDLAVEMLKARDIWDKTLEQESSLTKPDLLELLQGVLDTEHHLMPAIEARMQKASFDIMFLTGIGEVFPFIRSHNVLHNLQKSAKTRPTLMFFPGRYSHSERVGASLDLFGRLQDDRYYRAFNIYDIQP